MSGLLIGAAILVAHVSRPVRFGCARSHRRSANWLARANIARSLTRRLSSWTSESKRVRSARWKTMTPQLAASIAIVIALALAILFAKVSE